MQTTATQKTERKTEHPANHLAGETSPYLLQHAHNPVDWYPWGPEALERAKKEGKVIFLSIGYAACHWCHVMERESFEDEETARYLNEHFISVKVDREERPDIDEIYMTAVQMLTGGGGWPLTVFLTPDLKPFHGGTYFPPEERYGMPAFRTVLEKVVEAWTERPDTVRGNGEALTKALRANTSLDPAGAGAIDATIFDLAAEQLRAAFDPVFGGFGRAPKFPPNGAIALLLRRHQATGDELLLEMATLTLDRMARGGIYDQLGGGFHRYSTDPVWLTPHFEKMLYDNALLARVYTEAWQATGQERFRRVAVETLDYVLRDMTDARGAFHSSEDADSEGEEGKFYVWTLGEIEKVLGKEDAAFFNAYYGVTQEGNFEGHSILNVPEPPADFAKEKGLSEKEVERRLAPLRAKLLLVRDKRVRPGKDDKVLAAWNGMTISALARGHQAFGHDRFAKAAEKAADFILSEMVRDGVLLRAYRGDAKGGKSKLPAYLDDYAEMANGLVDLYEATFDLRWLEAADRLALRMTAEFWDAEEGAFFYTTENHKNLLARTKPAYDGATPSGNSTAVIALLRLGKLLDNADYRKKAEKTLEVMRGGMTSRPRALLNMLCSADFHLGPAPEIALAAKPGSPGAKALLGHVHGRFLPNKVLVLADPDSAAGRRASERIPLLKDRPMVSGKATAYVCENYVCKLPVTDVAGLRKILDRKP